MPYVFACLVVANFVLFGYFYFTPESPDASANYQHRLQKPIEATNVNDQMQPLIGVRD